MSGQTNFEKTLSQGGFTVICQCPSVCGTDLSAVRQFAASVKGKAVAVVAADNPGANIGACALAVAATLVSAGVEPILEMATRDRNRLALASDLLGAGALGVGNILCTDGTHPAKGGCAQTLRVYDLDAVQWLGAAVGVARQKALPNGAKVSGDASFFVGGRVNPFVQSPEMQLVALGKKVKAGAGFLITEPVTDAKLLEKWLGDAKKKAGACPILATVDVARGQESSCAQLLAALKTIKGLAGVCITSNSAEAVLGVLN